MMQKVLFFFYILGIHSGNFYIFLGSFFSLKLKLLYNGRKRTLVEINKDEVKFHRSIWVHCASLGEFEQGRPVIEAIKNKYPERKIILSFFSPSGYEIRKDFAAVDQVIYLPSDLPKNAQSLIKYYKPEIFILVKYEFWWSLIRSLILSGCKVYLISGVFRHDDYFFKNIFKPFKSILQKFDTIFVQDDLSSKTLSSVGIFQNQLTGDTRIDRVITNAQGTYLPENVLQFTKSYTTFVYGSVWMSDMVLVNELVLRYPDFRHIIAPHDISRKSIKEISEFLQQKSDLFSDELWQTKILIIDNIGLLNRLYSVAKYAYIGGGFGKGIHNILEPAVFGIPVFFGPNHDKFNEAIDLKNFGGAFCVNTSDEMLDYVQMMEAKSDIIGNIKVKSNKYFEKNKGATDKIIRHLDQFL